MDGIELPKLRWKATIICVDSCNCIPAETLIPSGKANPKWRGSRR